MSTLRPTAPTPLQEVADAELEQHGVRLFVKRDDLVHPLIPGNKWRKLKYNIEAARQRSGHTILTFGGAYSNHIFATASAGQVFGFRTVGVIRGEEHLPLNQVLRHATECGMTLCYMDRTTYRRKYDDDVIRSLHDKHGDFHLLPEGGTNCLAVRGCAEIVDEIDMTYDYICCPVGTGGTLSGLIVGLDGKAHALGFSVLKGGSFLSDDVERLLQECGAADHRYRNWSISTDYHFGGFARRTPELRDFVDGFTRRHGLRLDLVYTGKMMYGIFDLARRGLFDRGATVVALHTGGVPPVADGGPPLSCCDGERLGGSDGL